MIYRWKLNKPQKSTNSKLLSGEKLIWLFAGVYCLAIFFFLREKTLNGHDTANYYLAIKYGFSLAAERPHAPGYPLFIVLEQLLSSALNIDPHTALIVFADIFLFFGIVVCYKFVKKYWGGSVAVIVILLVARDISSPFTECVSAPTEI